MTTSATSLWFCGAVHVLSMIKFYVERFVEASWKIFQRRITATGIRVADLAHRYLRRSELAAVTISAGLVTWKAWCRGVVCAFVTGIAGKRIVPLARVEKF
jgi:hypothetical protein